MTSRRTVALLVPVLLLVGLSACSFSASAGARIGADEIAKKAEEALEKQVGARPDVSCPDALDAEKGNETRCTLTDPGTGTEYGMTATVTNVDGDDYRLGFEVDSAPKD